MQMKNLLVSSLLSATALAVPTTQQQGRAAAKSMMADATTWTITSLSRTCDAALTTCTWAFGINNGTATTPCTEVVTGTPATETNGGPATCGIYTVTSGWSGQFGPGNGFVSLLPSLPPHVPLVFHVLYKIRRNSSADLLLTIWKTTLSVVDYAANLIVFPAYTDKQLTNGTVVTPDQSYTPQALS